MNKVNDISEELKSMGSPLADMSRKMPYTIPSGYFENFGSDLKKTWASLEESDPQTNWGKALPYAVPYNYFESLTADLVQVATTQSPAGMPKENPFYAPAGYFESFPEKMLQAAKAKEKTKQIPLTFVPARWVAAAVILICISIGSYITFFSGNRAGTPDRILASIPESELHDYFLNTYRLDVDRIVSNTDISNLPLENKDIIQYLNETGWDVTE